MSKSRLEILCLGLLFGFSAQAVEGKVPLDELNTRFTLKSGLPLEFGVSIESFRIAGLRCEDSLTTSQVRSARVYVPEICDSLRSNVDLEFETRLIPGGAAPGYDDTLRNTTYVWPSRLEQSGTLDILKKRVTVTVDTVKPSALTVAQAECIEAQEHEFLEIVKAHPDLFENLGAYFKGRAADPFYTHGPKILVSLWAVEPQGLLTRTLAALLPQIEEGFPAYSVEFLPFQLHPVFTESGQCLKVSSVDLRQRLSDWRETDHLRKRLGGDSYRPEVSGDEPSLTVEAKDALRSARQAWIAQKLASAREQVLVVPFSSLATPVECQALEGGAAELTAGSSCFVNSGFPGRVLRSLVSHDLQDPIPVFVSGDAALAFPLGWEGSASLGSARLLCERLNQGEIGQQYDFEVGRSESYLARVDDKFKLEYFFGRPASNAVRDNPELELFGRDGWWQSAGSRVSPACASGDPSVNEDECEKQQEDEARSRRVVCTGVARR